jgi:hypothetical protein
VKAAPRVTGQFADPQPDPDVSLGRLVAATLNPLDVVMANGQFPPARKSPGSGDDLSPARGQLSDEGSRRDSGRL